MKRERSVKTRRVTPAPRRQTSSTSPRHTTERKRIHSVAPAEAARSVTTVDLSPTAQTVLLPAASQKVAIIKTENAPQGIVLMKLPPKRVLSFTWSWFWRSALYTLMATAVAVIIGFAVGILAGVVFLILSPSEAVKDIFLRTIGLLIGGMVGFGSLPFFLQWMTTHKVGKFRILLLADENGSTK